MSNFFLTTLLVLFFSAVVYASNVKVESVESPETFFGEREAICTITFDTGSTKLSPEAQFVLSQNVVKIKNLDLSKKMIRLEGFASPEGDREKNFRLSIDRARAVERFLRVNHGVSLDNYITGYGPTAPQGLSAAGKKTVQIVVYDNPWGMADVPVKMTGGQK